MLSICIPTYNRLPHLKKCLDSILKGFEDFEYEIVIADGGSTDGTIKYLKKHENVILIEQKKLTGAVKASNECFKRASGDFIFLATDDFEIIPNVIKKACVTMEKEPKIGLIGPKMQEVKHGNLHNVLLWMQPYWVISPKIYIFQRKVLKEINYFDEKFRTYYVDVDAPLKVMSLGYSIAVTRDVGIIHHRIHDQKINIAKAKNIKRIHTESEYHHLRQKWVRLEELLKKYMEQHSKIMKKSLRYKRYAAMMYHSKKLHPLIKISPVISNKVYDFFLEKMLIFKDHQFDHIKSLFLIQNFPKEILDDLNKK